MIYCFVGLAVICDDYMVPALETLCVRWGVREDVAGATFMAFGSAAPEIIINSVQTVKERVDTPTTNTTTDPVALGVGAIVGSGMIAIMVIPAVCALFSDEPLRIKRRPMFRDMGFYMLILFLVTLFLQSGHEIVLWEAAVLTFIYIVYVLTVVFSHSVRRRYLRDVRGQVLVRCDSFVIREKERRAQIASGIDPENTESKEKPNQRVEYKNNDGKGGLVEDDDDDDSSSGHEHVVPSLVNMKRALEAPRISRASSKSASVRDGNMEEPLLGGDLDDEDITTGCCWVLMQILWYLKLPLDILFKITCPQTEVGSKLEMLYPLAFIISFGWIALFSFIISEIVEEWVIRTGVNEAFFGLTLIAVGAEVPDTIQSVTVAKRGYGSMAVSNCIGSQIVNLCIGLGFSWLLGILSSGNFTPIRLTKNGIANVSRAACCQTGAWVFVFCILFGPTIYSRFKIQKLRLSKTHGCILLAAYIVTLTTYAVLEAVEGQF